MTGDYLISWKMITKFSFIALEYGFKYQCADVFGDNNDEFGPYSGPVCDIDNDVELDYVPQ